MANLVTFAKKLWKDKVGGNTPITAAELNRMEKGISDCATQINKLGDSVSPFTNGIVSKITSNAATGILLQIRFTSNDGKAYGFSVLKDGIQLWNFTDSVTIWKISK